MLMRELRREELELYWTIDRREVLHNIYVMRNGEMVLTPHYVDVPGWPDINSEKLYSCFDRGGTFLGMFDGDRLVGASAVDMAPRGENGDLLELGTLHVSRDYRGKGVGTRLFDAAKDIVRKLGSPAMYVSATPTENTVNFYLHRGCRLAVPPDLEALALEPDDIHLVCDV
jgi:GNAT superfamily N-acetyltransferase